MLDLQTLFVHAVNLDASDLLLKVGTPPALRVAGRVTSLGGDPVTDDIMAAFFEKVCRERIQKKFHERGEVDVSYEVFGVGRFRANVFRQRGHIGMVFRFIKSKIPALDELHLPAEPLRRLARFPRGLVLVTGTAGSGKSTTIASIIEYLNENTEKHVITIEDPIEYQFKDNRCFIDQREIGEDSESFASALKHAVRQSPDILMVGEMRDPETMEAALSAAETGHMVFSTLHSQNAMQTIDRILSFYPAHKHDFLKLQLSQLLKGVISQRLLPTKEGDRRVPAVELMMSTPHIQELLLHGKTRELYNAVREGGYFGCQTFNQSLRDLLDRGMVSLEYALEAADAPEELKQELSGISREVVSTGTRWKTAK